MSDPIEWTRWPNLGGFPKGHPKLDRRVRVYQAAKIRQMADAAEKGDWNPWTKATVEVLRALVDSPAALDQLNHDQHRPKIMGLNRAVHYHVRLEIAGDGDKAKARKQVGAMWGGKKSLTVKADIRDHGKEAKRIIEELLDTLQKLRGKTRAELLDDFDRDMIHRAKHMRRER